ncbi:MAG: hypothetical protein MI892_21120 [Desulfobacterales bacterium]|nr:hypothetical protein [Desulfobacterales bacterium]
MELLIIKTGKRYLRIKDGAFLVVNLDKASVYPMDQLDQVNVYARDAKAEGLSQVHVKKLILTEEDLQ